MMFSPPLYDTIIPHILVVVKKIPEKYPKNTTKNKHRICTSCTEKKEMIS